MAVEWTATSLNDDADPRHSPLSAMRAEPGMVVALLAAAGLAWWWTAERMAGMNAGPGSDLGPLGWFAGLWTVMMAAMMLPSLAPAAALLAAPMRRGSGRVLLFAGGYLLVWSAVGLVAYELFELGRSSFAASLAWRGGGRWLAAGLLVLAALYQLTTIKRAFLMRCRCPLGDRDARWLGSRRGAFTTGLRTGGWCLGCSWALMASLFALGVMSLASMALISGLVALEKLGPRERASRIATASVFIVLAVTILAAPHELPGFVVPGSAGSTHSMKTMG